MPLNVSPSEKQELLVTYAALILHDDGAPITAENIQKLITAAGGTVEPYWPKLFASLLEGKNVGDLLLNAGGSGGGAPSSGGSSGSAGEEKKDGGKAPEKEKEKEKSEESEADMGFSLFD